ncbi:MAG: hypothetical protein RQ723_10825 [Desulfuromonadales bacterium]|nr:hypothetical protein [Desulfuromonadales bacterium]
MTEQRPDSEFALPGEAHRKLALIVYILQAASLPTSGMTLFAGVIINYIRRDDVRGTWLESHFRWQIRTFWYWLLWTAIGAVTAVFLVGWAILTAVMLWLIYRVVKGWLYLSEGRVLTS